MRNSIILVLKSVHTQKIIVHGKRVKMSAVFSLRKNLSFRKISPMR